MMRIDSWHSLLHYYQIPVNALRTLWIAVGMTKESGFYKALKHTLSTLQPNWGRT